MPIDPSILAQLEQQLIQGVLTPTTDKAPIGMPPGASPRDPSIFEMSKNPEVSERKAKDDEQAWKGLIEAKIDILSKHVRLLKEAVEQVSRNANR